jgi:ribonucleoside-diphosphate reductase beta chain
LNGLAGGTNWVFRDESAHMTFAFEVINTVKREQPELFDAEMKRRVLEMIKEAVECETLFAEDLLQLGVAGLSVRDMRAYLEFVADQRLAMLDIAPCYGAKNPFPFMDLQDVQELANFFERRVSSYQVGVTGSVVFDEAF